MRALRVAIALAISIALMGVVFSLARSVRLDHTDEICRVRLLRMGEAIALFVEDHGGAIFPEVRNPPPFTPWTPGMPQSPGEVLRPYLGGDLHAAPQRDGETRDQWLIRARASEMSVCPATRFPYLANLAALSQSPAAFSRSGETAWIFRCQGYDAQRPAHRRDGRGISQIALLGSEERSVPRSELDDLAKRIRELEAQEDEATNRERRRRLDALSHRQAALERAFADGRTSATVRRLTNGVDAEPYPP